MISYQQYKVLEQLREQLCKSGKRWAEAFEEYGLLTESHSYKMYEAYQEFKEAIPRNVRLDILATLSTYYRVDETIGDEIAMAYAKETSCNRLKRIAKNKEELKDFIDEDGFITAYRGEKEVIVDGRRWRSLDLDEAISFTTDWHVAAWFAQRYGGVAKVYTVKIPLENVVMYYTERHEAEVIVVPQLYHNGIKIESVEILTKEQAQAVQKHHEEECRKHIVEFYGGGN